MSILLAERLRKSNTELRKFAESLYNHGDIDRNIEVNELIEANDAALADFEKSLPIPQCSDCTKDGDQLITGVCPGCDSKHSKFEQKREPDDRFSECKHKYSCGIDYCLGYECDEFKQNV